MAVEDRVLDVGTSNPQELDFHERVIRPRDNSRLWNRHDTILDDLPDGDRSGEEDLSAAAATLAQSESVAEARAPGVALVFRGPALLAGRAVHRPAPVTSSSSSRAHPAAVSNATGWRRPPDEKTKRRVVRAFLCPLAQRLWMNRAEPRSTVGIDYGHNDLRSARRIEDDPVKHRAAAGNPHSFTNVCRFHRHSLLRLPLPDMRATTPNRAKMA